MATSFFVPDPTDSLSSRFRSCFIIAGALFVLSRLLIPIFRYIAFRSFTIRNSCQPGQQLKQWDPFLGAAVVLRIMQDYKARRLLETLRGYSNSISHTFGLWMVMQRVVVTSEPDNIKTILSSSFDDFELGSNRRYGMRFFIGDGIFATDGQKWHDARSLLRSSFAKSRICDTDLFETHFQNFLNVLTAEGSHSIDLQAPLRALSMDIITDMLFGASTNALHSLDKDESHDFSNATEYALKSVFRNIGLGWLGTILPDAEAYEAKRILDRAVDHYVDRALHLAEKSKGVPTDDQKQLKFLDHLAQITQDPQVLRDQLLSALIGGRDTTSNLLSNLLHALSRNPEAWQRLRAEALSLEHQVLDLETMRNAFFARQCLNESLRLHAVAPLNQRVANKHTVLPKGGGSDGNAPLAIAKNTLMYIPVYTLHRRKDIYGQDADEFKPERWANLHPGWAFAPFGGGPRLCIGQEFALSEASYILLRMAQEFETIVAADDEPWREDFGLTLSNALGCKVKLYRAIQGV